MSECPTGPILECFENLEDPRVEHLCDHKLLDIVVLTICAVICGANYWTDEEMYGHAKESWLRGFLELTNGVPSHDTIGSVFARLDPNEFRTCFVEWVKTVNDLMGTQVVALDGKTVRRSHDKTLGRNAIHMVSAWATKSNLVLGQVKVDEKSNEITAIPTLLDMLELSGCIVTIDAMGCQKEIAQEILDKGADYVLAVKDNQPTLHRKIRELFGDGEETDDTDISHDIYTKTEKGHGRIETRSCCVIDDPDCLFYLQGPKKEHWWPGLRTIIKIEATRRIGNEVSSQIRYYISSLSASAKTLNGAIRSHWGVENGLHWVLDIAFREDESRVRKGNAAESFAILRHMALNLLKQEKTAKVGVQGKRLKAAWDNQYLLRLLAA
jgi:predicted transposase YbfD/YdcC